MIYFDHAAATPIHPSVLEKMLPYFSKQWGNPSALYQHGQKASRALDHAREQCASTLGCNLDEIFFTGSGTESCNWALIGSLEPLLQSGQKPHLIISAIEHSSIITTAKYLERRGAIIDYCPISENGVAEVKVISSLIQPNTALVSIMYVNNEIGTVQPINKISQLCKDNNIAFHSDACQAAPYFNLNVDELGVNLLTLNGSKIYGPKGVGILYIRKGTMIEPFIHGGGQEYGMRGGTENVPAIVGLGEALTRAQSIRQQESTRLIKLRDYGINQLKSLNSSIKINGSLTQRTPNNVNFTVPGISADTLVTQLDLKGICVSTGSACTSGKIEPSHVLSSLGLSKKESQSSIRISLGEENTKEEIDEFISVLEELI
jgi:cysteine desulfurase